MQGKIISSGRLADVYEKGDSHVIKLFHDGIPRDMAEQEAQRTNLVRNAGIDAPFVHGVVEVDGRFGVEFDRIFGPNLLEWMMRNPNSTQKLSRFFAFHHHEMHLHRMPELPSYKETLESKISSCGELDDPIKSKLLKKLKSLPDGESLIHGNLHPFNMIISLDGPVFLDWTDAGRGPYLADVARTMILMEVKALPESFASDAEAVRALNELRNIYYMEYLKMCGKFDDELTVWRPIMAAARLAEGVPEEKDRLLRIVREEMS